MRSVTTREHRIIKNSACVKAMENNSCVLNKENKKLLYQDSEKEHRYTGLMNIADCYDYWYVFFDFKIKAYKKGGKLQ